MDSAESDATNALNYTMKITGAGPYRQLEQPSLGIAGLATDGHVQEIAELRQQVTELRAYILNLRTRWQAERTSGRLGVAGSSSVPVVASQAPLSSTVGVRLLAAMVRDLRALVLEKSCGPILIRLSWHDAGVYSSGRKKGGCPNAAMRFRDGGEGTFGANAGLPTVALSLLQPISSKYVNDLGVISHTDLWALAANVAIDVMGGPPITTRFGRVDAGSSKDSVEGQEGRLPDGDKGPDHLRDIFWPKGFSDKDIVALSGAHTVGANHLDRSGFDGPWTENPLTFDNTYFKDLVFKSYKLEQTAKGLPQNRHGATGTVMLQSDLALLTDPAFKVHVYRYASDQAAFFADFADAWVRLQELGYTGLLRDTL